ncbi:hypothetical protein ACHAWX_002721 [Stephanocyclus meneghinianus]
MAFAGTSLAVWMIALLQRHSHAWTSAPPSNHRYPSKLAATKSDSESTRGILPTNSASSRRGFFRDISSRAALASSLLLSSSSWSAFPYPALAIDSDDDDLIDVYFGCGCFWHVQHEFVEAERRILSRSDERLTSRAGYAGGTSPVDGRVCYHNAANVADYGALGHAEVVSLRIPSRSFGEFAVEYCRLFDENGLRPDQFGDRGGEYRNLVGVPGGKDSVYAKLLVEASVKTGDKLDFAVGKGNDGDVPKVSFIMDSNKFPAYVAERYHQVSA